MSSQLSTDRDEMFNPAVGLWTQQGGGHTSSMSGMDSVHPGPLTVMHLLVAFQTSDGSDFPTLAALQGLRRTQIVEPGPQFGGFKWYLEEPELADDHAIFFNGMGFVALWAMYREKLSPECRELLSLLMKDMRIYAKHAVYRRKHYFPNEFLGYLLCAWFPAAWFGSPADSEDIAGILEQSADGWLEDGWGWGEHLSNIYGNVLLDELSLLLLFGNTLPARVRAKLQHLFNELLRVDDHFEGGPRVPLIRSYAFASAPGSSDYRKQIKPMPTGALFTRSDAMGKRLDTVCAPYRTADGQRWVPLGHSLYEAGWHELAPARTPPSELLEVACHSGIVARAYLDADLRVGTLSKFPLMPSAEHARWGLSWQSFPVCYWHADGAWGYTQWETKENGVRRCHPAEEKYSAYLNPALTQAINPPITGKTYCLQQGGDFLALRIMPAIAGGWERLVDRFRLLGSPASIQARSDDSSWSQLVVQYGPRTVGLQCIALGETIRPQPMLCQSTDSRWDWEVVWERADLQNCRSVVTLWGFSLSGEVREAPQIERIDETMRFPRDPRSESRWRLHWKWSHTDWRIEIDPLSDTPLCRRD